jgi:hypothetical protein
MFIKTLSSSKIFFAQVKLQSLRTTPALDNMACNKTLQPAAMCSGLASSISLWLMPSLQGIKIMPLGAKDSDLVNMAALAAFNSGG